MHKKMVFSVILQIRTVQSYHLNVQNEIPEHHNAKGPSLVS